MKTPVRVHGLTGKMEKIIPARKKGSPQDFQVLGSLLSRSTKKVSQFTRRDIFKYLFLNGLTFCFSLMSFPAPLFQFVPYIFLCLPSKTKHQMINLDIVTVLIFFRLTQLTKNVCIN